MNIAKRGSLKQTKKPKCFTCSKQTAAIKRLKSFKFNTNLVIGQTTNKTPKFHWDPMMQQQVLRTAVLDLKNVSVFDLLIDSRSSALIEILHF